ncbi:MAG: efflux RND transporter periplasmic adaptor subunit, partial [Planctomycetota bacterium]
KSNPPLLWMFVCLAPFLGACNPSPDVASTSGPSKAPQKVAVAKAQQEELIDHVQLVGRLKADKSVSIRSRVSGFLQKIHFVDGQRVQAGEVLFSIEPDEYRAIYDQAAAQIAVAQTRVDLAEKKFARSEKLLKGQATSREEYDENKAAVAEARAQLVASQADAARVKLDVDYTEITSPISGRVDRALLDEGNFVSGGLGGGTVLTTIVNDRPINAVANIDENVRLQIMRRQREVAGDDFEAVNKLADLQIPCGLQLQDETDFPHEGILEYAEVLIDEQTGTSQLRAVFENEDGLLKSGMFVRLKLPVSDPHPAVLIPDSAVGTDQATKFVYVINAENEVEHRSVEIGDRRGSLRVVVSGVKEGESVIVAGMQLVQPGVKVNPVPAGES